MPSLEPATANKIIILIYNIIKIFYFLQLVLSFAYVLPVGGLLMTKHVAVVSVL